MWWYVWAWSARRNLKPKFYRLPRPWSLWGSSPARENSHCRTGNRTRDLMTSSQNFWPPSHEADPCWKFHLRNFSTDFYEISYWWCSWKLVRIQGFFLPFRSRLYVLRPGYGSFPYQYHATLDSRNFKDGMISALCSQAVRKDVMEFWKGKLQTTQEGRKGCKM
jgi:hypothetical protein